MWNRTSGAWWLVLVAMVGCVAVDDGPAADLDAGRPDEEADAGVLALAAGARVTLNEIESTGGSPGDWAELFNAGTAVADVGGWRLRDGDAAHPAYVLPAGTTIAPGGFLVLDEASWGGGFGLGAADAARLFDASGAQVDSYAWTAHATTSYGRCADGTGGFVTTVAPTKGAANACAAPPPSSGGWPGRNAVVTVDAAGAFGTNVSGLSYQAGASAAADALWAVRNQPSLLYRLVWNGATWTAASGWAGGKALRYPGGGGRPDAEDLTRTEASSTSMYVVAERDNDVASVSRLSLLRYDTAAAGASLTATHEWNLTGDLPAVDANGGLEGLTWVPDSFLVARGFLDEAAGHVYRPADYPDHGSGLFFVGLEATGTVHVYALRYATGGFTRVATIAGGHPRIMSLQFDRDTGYLWTACDDTCGNRLAVLVIDGGGRFRVTRTIARPSTLPNVNHEAIAFAPAARCVGGARPFYWADDAATAGHVLRADTIPCGAFVP